MINERADEQKEMSQLKLIEMQWNKFWYSIKELSNNLLGGKTKGKQTS